MGVGGQGGGGGGGGERKLRCQPRRLGCTCTGVNELLLLSMIYEKLHIKSDCM